MDTVGSCELDVVSIDGATDEDESSKLVYLAHIVYNLLFLTLNK